MRTPSLRLFELIKKLSQTEKRYLRLFASMQGEQNNYMLLFNEIEKQNQYDEEVIRKKFRNEKFIKQLTVAKTYLYNLILKSLRNYHAENNVEMTLKVLLQDIGILHEKGLYAHADELIEKGIKLSGKYEKHTFLIELLSWKATMFSTRSYAQKTEKDVIELYKSIRNNIKLLDNLYLYRGISSRLYHKSQTSGKIRSKADLEPFNLLMSDTALKNDKHALSYHARLSFYSSWFAYYTIQNNYEKAYPHLKKIIRFMEEYPHQLKEQTKSYVSAILNKGTCEFQLKRFSDLTFTVKTLDSLYQESSSFLKRRIFYWKNYFELLVYTNTNEIAKGEAFIEDVNKKIAKEQIHPVNTFDELQLWSSATYLYMVAGKYKKANTYLNKILTSEEVKLREHIYAKNMILQLILHFDSGKQDLLEYSVKSVYRILYKKNRLYKLENILLKFIREKTAWINTDKKMAVAFTELLNELKLVYKNPWERIALEEFDLLAWLESKIHKKSFAEVLKSKAV